MAAAERGERRGEPVGRAVGEGRWERAAWWVWGLAVAAVCLRSALTPYSHNVYPIYSGAARAWLEGAPLYERPFAGLDVFRYSPLIACLFVPLNRLPAALANILWRVLSAGVLGSGLWGWGRRVLPWQGTDRQYAALALLVLPLALGSLNNGQANALLTGLLLWAVVLTAERCWSAAALLLALAAWWKVYPLLLGLLLMLTAPRRLGQRLLLMLAILGMIPFFLQHPHYVAEQYASWVRYLLKEDRQQLPVDYWLRDARLLLRASGVSLPAPLYLGLQVGTGLGLVVLCWAERRSPKPQRWQLTWVTGLACSWMLALGPSAESCTYVLLAPALAGALLGNWEKQTLFPKVFLILSYLLLVLSAAAVWFPWNRTFTNWGPQPLAALLCLSVFLLEPMYARWRAPCAPAQTSENSCARWVVSPPAILEQGHVPGELLSVQGLEE